MVSSLRCFVARGTLAVALLLALSGCGKDASGELGEAYVAPASLNLRRELNQRSGTATVLKHGDRVSVIEVRRRFVKIRTRQGDEGWVDALQLLSPQQMEQIRRDARQALLLPSQGSASVFEPLNVHIDPSRDSPAFTKIPEGGSVSVLAHRVEPKASAPPRIPSFLTSRPQPASNRRKKERQSRGSTRLPSRPLPPKPPENWQDLSAERIDGAESTADVKANKDKEAAEKKAAELKKPLVLEDWSLVRTKDNQCGWVLSRNLVMSIPDEVAQYAEGKRISSYFDLGAVPDDVKGTKHNWLWTTSSQVEPYDFDAWRVFLWNRRRHRYETSYRQRDVEGYFPVQVDPAGENAFGRTFHLITKDDDGKYRRRTYFFDGTRVHLTATEEYRPDETAQANKTEGTGTNRTPPASSKPGWLRREWGSLRERLFGSR